MSFFDAEFKLVERVGQGGPHDLVAVAGLLLDLLEEESVLFRESGPEALVQDLGAFSSVDLPLPTSVGLLT
jgi:hypothetical protein